MPDWLPMTITGASLLVLGVLMMRSHTRTWRYRQSDESLDEGESQYFKSQYRRRMQTSAIIALLGVMLFVGDVVLPLFLERKNLAAVFGVYWLVVLLLTLWIFVLAWGDVAAIRVHSQTALARNRRKQQELEKQIVELKRRRSNGEASSN